MSRRIPSVLKRQIRERAGDACEYCKLPQAESSLDFPIDHIIAQQHGGKTELDNLALCCGFCNRHKGPNISGIDPLGGTPARLFNPRADDWASHFRWQGEQLVGLTDIGRVTVMVLAVNEARQVAIRQALIEEGRFPPN